MVHNSYIILELEVILDLLKNGENHLRGISKNLDVSHTTVLRKIRKLSEENVLDCEKRGRNSVYSLKKNMFAMNYVYMAEYYKAIRFLGIYPEMSIVLKDVVSRTTSELIIVFGSYAKFTVNLKSDIDIYIETRNRKLAGSLEMVDNRINLKIGEFNLENPLIKEIIKNHVIIKGVEDFYAKTKFL